MAEPQPPFSPPLSPGLFFAHRTVDGAEYSFEGSDMHLTEYSFDRICIRQNMHLRELYFDRVCIWGKMHLRECWIFEVNFLP